VGTNRSLSIRREGANYGIWRTGGAPTFGESPADNLLLLSALGRSGDGAAADGVLQELIDFGLRPETQRLLASNVHGCG
jgi:pentatricopeptide repeat protein